jgi:dienelactone hydrolase
VSFVNRYGAKLYGHLWRPKLPWRDPVTGRQTTGPLPAVVFDPGFGSNDSIYIGIVEQLAESGYVVLSFSPQGNPPSDTAPNPTSTYCNSSGVWRQPQEVGIREQGPCAGEDPPGTGAGPLPVLDSTPLAQADGLAALAQILVQAHANPAAVFASISTTYDAFRPRFVFGALDAVAWLLSVQDPWHGLIDGARVGIAGHSAGADGALVAGNGDPRHRFAAAAAFDTYGNPPAAMSPTVPTMMQRAEQENLLGPQASPPDPRWWPPTRIGTAFRAAGIDTMTVSLRGSTHQEWGYVPYALSNPLSPVEDSSSEGNEVAVYYALAWFDRYLKGRPVAGEDSASAAAQAADASRRLLARRFDDSADRSSIGSGRWDPGQGRNVPYRLAGLAVPNLLSFYLPSPVSIGSVRCADLRGGCEPASSAPNRRSG